MSEPNPEYVNAPYRVGFWYGLPMPECIRSIPRRKKRLKAMRRFRKNWERFMFRPPEPIRITPEDFEEIRLIDPIYAEEVLRIQPVYAKLWVPV